MKVIKHFETSIDITDIEKLYQPLSIILMEELKAKYEGRCFKSSYVIEIKEITHYSSCEISTDHQQCIGLVDVMFSALVEIYTPGNIIPLCHLEIKRSNGEFIAKSNDAKIQLVPNENDKILPAFKVGDKFPIQVKDVTYGPHQKEMSIVGCLPEIKPEKLVIYKINPADYKELFTVKQLKAIEEFISVNDKSKWISGLNAADKKKLDEYVAVTYPYQNNKVPSMPKTSQFNFMDVKELSKLNLEKQPFYICYPPEISRSRPFGYFISNIPLEQSIDSKTSFLHQLKNSIFEENPMVVITEWITVHHNYMEMIKSLTENYPSPTSDRYKALWGLIHLKKEN